VKEILKFTVDLDIMDWRGYKAVDVASSCYQLLKESCAKTQLFYYCEENMAKEFKKAFDKRYVDATNGAGYSLLHFAIINKNEDLVEFLLNNDASIHPTKNDNKTQTIISAVLLAEKTEGIDESAKRIRKIIAQHILKTTAAVRTEFTAFKNELDRYPDLINFKYHHKKKENSKIEINTLLHIACKNSNVKCVEYIIQQLSDDVMKKKTINCVDHKDKTPLHYAASVGSLSCVELLLNVKLADNTPCAEVSSKDHKNYTPLHRAAKGMDNNKKGCVQRLVQAGCSIYDENRERLTPLALHIYNQEPEVYQNSPTYKYLNKIHNGYLLIEYSRTCNFEQLKSIIADADLTVRDSKKRTALHYAYKRKFTAGISLLKQYGASEEAVDSSIHKPSDLGKRETETPDYYDALDFRDRCSQGRLKEAKDIWRRYNKEKNFIDKENNKDYLSPLYCAVIGGIEIESEDGSQGSPRTKGFPVVVAWLLKNGADKSYANRNGDTALHAACRRADYAVAKILIEGGCSLKVRNSSGKKPVELLPYKLSKKEGSKDSQLSQNDRDQMSAIKKIEELINNWGIVQRLFEIVNGRQDESELDKFFRDLRGKNERKQKRIN